MELKETMKRLCSLSGPSGYEDEVRGAVAEILTPLTDEVEIDILGNVKGIKRCGKPDAKMLLLDAHMDEIGLIVTGHEKGFLRFENVGGIDKRMLPAREVLVMTEPPIRGIIDTMPPHALAASEMEKSIDPDKLYIDVGLSEESAKELVPLGTPVVFAAEPFDVGEGQVCAKALDDRAGAAIILKVMENLADKDLKVDVCAMISTQEEVGCRGAKPGAFGVDPDYAIAIDVTFGKTPDVKKSDAFKMGGGPAIVRGPSMNRALTNALFATAEKLGIECQTEVLPGNCGTNAWVMQVSREGVATAGISPAVKYMHSPIEVISISDAEDIVRILTELISTMDGEEVKYA